jgi:hypothetical protein
MRNVSPVEDAGTVAHAGDDRLVDDKTTAFSIVQGEERAGR